MNDVYICITFLSLYNLEKSRINAEKVRKNADFLILSIFLWRKTGSILPIKKRAKKKEKKKHLFQKVDIILKNKNKKIII
jgi:hypothetical protein